jgi:hypothetical protein
MFDSMLSPESGGSVGWVTGGGWGLCVWVADTTAGGAGVAFTWEVLQPVKIASDNAVTAAIKIGRSNENIATLVSHPLVTNKCQDLKESS